MEIVEWQKRRIFLPVYHPSKLYKASLMHLNFFHFVFSSFNSLPAAAKLCNWFKPFLPYTSIHCTRFQSLIFRNSWLLNAPQSITFEIQRTICYLGMSKLIWQKHGWGKQGALGILNKDVISVCTVELIWLQVV